MCKCKEKKVFFILGRSSSRENMDPVSRSHFDWIKFQSTLWSPRSTPWLDFSFPKSGDIQQIQFLRQFPKTYLDFGANGPIAKISRIYFYWASNDRKIWNFPELPDLNFFPNARNSHVSSELISCIYFTIYLYRHFVQLWNSLTFSLHVTTAQCQTQSVKTVHKCHLQNSVDNHFQLSHCLQAKRRTKEFSSVFFTLETTYRFHRQQHQQHTEGNNCRAFANSLIVLNRSTEKY